MYKNETVGICNTQNKTKYVDICKAISQEVTELRKDVWWTYLLHRWLVMFFGLLLQLQL